MLKLKYILLLTFLLPTVSFAASAVMLVNPPTLYFSKANIVKLKQIETILEDAVERSSTPQVIWSVDDKKPNNLVVKFFAKGKHTAFLDINYDKNKIRVKYKDSHNLKYKKQNNLIDMIHPNYHVWVDFFVQKIKFSIDKHTKLTLLENNPVAKSDMKKGGQYFVLIAEAVPGKRDEEDYSLSDTTEEFSALLLKQLEKSINETQEGNVEFKAIAWDEGETIKRLLKETRKKEVSKKICKTYNADKILYADAPRAYGRHGSRDITYYLYICSNGRKIKELYEIDRTNEDTYGYQYSLIHSTRDFIEYSNAYK